MKKVEFRELEGRGVGYWGLVASLAVVVAVGLGAAYHMEHEGHWVTGMSNQIVWGTPHVFAVFLIVAASGALNVASVGSVFGRDLYKPLGPLSGLLAAALLVGGLAVLVLDLGRPERLVVAMTTYNFKSIFAWNIFLYTGFIAVVALYLWMMMEHRMREYSKAAGYLAFFWRLILTTGTGSIFGFLVAREAYDAAILAPMFVIMSFYYGLAIFLLVLMAAYHWSGRPLGNVVLFRLKNLLGIFAGAVLYFTLAFHLTALYATEHHGAEWFILAGGGVYTALFWIGHVLVGGLLPVALVYHPTMGSSRGGIVAASILAILGGLAQLYVIIIGGQAYPLNIFPGMEVSSTFFDGVVGQYTPSLPEVLLGLGGVAIALIMVAVAAKFLRFLPLDLSDDVVAPGEGEVRAAGRAQEAAAA